jgi:NADPH:quinone reductase-like Zn-dependent oxidoreductase
VSIFALQFAKAMGARVIATTSSVAKAERIKALGADAIIDYVATPDWDAEALRLTERRGVDRVVEVSGALDRALRSVRVGGRIVMIGAVGGVASCSPVAAILRGATLHTAFVGNRDGFEAMNRVIEARGIRPVIDRIFPFSEAAEAYRHFFSRAHVGKVVIAL